MRVAVVRSRPGVRPRPHPPEHPTGTHGPPHDGPPPKAHHVGDFGRSLDGDWNMPDAFGPDLRLGVLSNGVGVEVNRLCPRLDQKEGPALTGQA